MVVPETDRALVPCTTRAIGSSLGFVCGAGLLGGDVYEDACEAAGLVEFMWVAAGGCGSGSCRKCPIRWAGGCEIRISDCAVDSVS